MHTSDATQIDRSKSGAEWWVQVRDPSGPAAAIKPHWDKDEMLRSDTGIWVHPQLSTVTYLTAGGSPTLVLGRRSTGDGTCPLSGSAVSTPGSDISTLVFSQPRVGKHLVFDGQLLHLVAPQLATQYGDLTEERFGTISEPAGVRVTFLVNVSDHSSCPCSTPWRFCADTWLYKLGLGPLQT
jgi:hypothetical protein